MYSCIGGKIPVEDWDRAPFKFTHQLVNHPSLSLESLAKTLPQLPPEKVQLSKGLVDLGINFDRAHLDHSTGLNVEKTIERLKTTNSYIQVIDPEAHPAFSGLYRDLLHDATALMRGARDLTVLQPRMWLFIASPNAVTPFHFDRYTNFLMQVRGSKQIAVFPNFREDIISAADTESYMDRVEAKPLWRDELDQHAQKFDFRPGDALHIPYISGHYVKNGPEDISISISFFFQTDETLRWTNAMRLNHRLRKRLRQVGLAPLAVGREPNQFDSLKARVMPLFDGFSRLKNRLAG